MVFCFAITLFVSAALLFLVQPMVGKMLLPLLGGTPAVWNACMVFFQAALLAGYLYAHALARGPRVRLQAAVHGVVLLAALAFLPLRVAGGAPPPADAEPVFWLLGRLLLTVGAPFFVVASTAPLLQKWFSRTNHPDARDPYFLYSASNVGSLLALLGYPLFVERTWELGRQSWIWAGGYGALIALVGCCAWLAIRAQAAPAANAVTDAPPDASSAIGANAAQEPDNVNWGRRLRWLLLAAVPSSLTLGVTTHITTDIAAVPLLWVLPLALYLLTFILVFAKKPPLPHALVKTVFPFALVILGPLTVADILKLPWLAFLGAYDPWGSIVPHLLLFFLTAMTCHGELARNRPSPRHLTEFYLWMSAGGVAGGCVNAILAPLVFVHVWEYPLMLIAAALVLVRSSAKTQKPREKLLDWGVPAALAAAGALGLAALWFSGAASPAGALVWFYGVAAIVCLRFRERALRFGLGFGVALALAAFMVGGYFEPSPYASRNFFGVKRVVLTNNGTIRKLGHGRTVHGAQRVADAAGAPEPLTYYHRTGPLADVFAALKETRENPRIGVIGLGAGSVAAYGEPGWHFTFYEIDPAVAEVARDPRYFTFLQETRAAHEIVLGDGRLKIAQAPDASYDLILLDAFSSDAIPTHLLSQEAVQTYLSKLKPGGLLVFHISNQLLNFEPMLAALAEELKLASLTRFDQNVGRELRAAGKEPARYFVMARAPADLQALATRANWQHPTLRPGVAVWTDRYCDLLALLAGK